MRRLLPFLGCLAAGGVLLAVFGPGDPPGPGTAPGASPGPAGSPAARARADLVAGARAYLREHPTDARAWTALGGAHLDEAGRTGDPAHYTMARSAFRHSLSLSPEADAMIGMGVVANVRHEHGAARVWGARAFRAAPHRWPLYGVLAGAYTGLGRYGRADLALRRMLGGTPDVAALTRAADLLRVRGESGRARAVLRRAGLAAASSASSADVARYAYGLGELEWSLGRPRQAVRAYGRALAADPGHAPAYAGRARAEAALGLTGAAVRDYGAAAARDPGYTADLGELYEYLGQPERAARQYALFTSYGLARVDVLRAGRFEADHGDPASAVRRLRAEWNGHRAPEVADALAWALHRAGHNAEAATYAARAEPPGARDALAAYHRGEIARALGDTVSARAHLARALRINPYFSLDGAPRARQALIELPKAPPPPPPPPPSPKPTAPAKAAPSATPTPKPSPTTVKATKAAKPQPKHSATAAGRRPA
ncbi:tetratricopeptide repeat protein [Streptosporangium saharense]|uniref:tetratricopeptide repeat protein n=1 Tax=Streptosporangium saharense TaxID=1706840 RepID=UPI0036992E9E